MSKLLQLFDGSQYARLSNFPAQEVYKADTNQRESKNFSVRNQSNINEAARQSTAVNFFSNSYQNGFNVSTELESNPKTVTIRGWSKAEGVNFSDFTGETSGPTRTGVLNAFDTFNRFATDSLRTAYKSKLIHRYYPTSNRASDTYLGANSSKAGVVLTYTPAP